MIREIVNPEAYPKNILNALQGSRNLSISIANRWMLGWPERVEKLIQAGQFQELLHQQTETELDARVEAGQSGKSHLAPWEINEMAGIDPAPPVL